MEGDTSGSDGGDESLSKHTVIKQRLQVPLGFSILMVLSGVVLLWMALNVKTPALGIILATPAIAMFIAPLIVPIAHIIIEDESVKLVSIRMLGLWKRTSYDIRFEDIDCVQCPEYPFTFGLKEVGVIVHSKGQRIVAGSIFSIEDRRRLASHLWEQSSIHGFGFEDNVGPVEVE